MEEENDMKGCATIMYIGVLGFILYGCISKAQSVSNVWWIVAIILIIAIIAGIVLFFFDKNIDKKKKEDIKPQALLAKTLEKLNLKYHIEESVCFYVEYHGEMLRIACDDSYKSLKIVDAWWYKISLNDVDITLYKAINEYNASQGFSRVACTIDDKNDCVGIHTLCILLWESSISNIDEYLQFMFDDLLHSHHELFNIMEKLRKEELEKFMKDGGMHIVKK